MIARVALVSLHVVLLALPAPCLWQSAPAGQAPDKHPLRPGRTNVLLVVLDDIGIDALALYGLNPGAAPTPNIDQIAASGLLFRNAYAHPICSPSRASMMTGRYPFRTGVGDAVHEFGGALPLSEIILPRMLDLGGAGYAHAAFGKWHLSNDNFGRNLAPNLLGFSHFAGTMFNFSGEHDYFEWLKVVDDTRFMMNGYITSDTVDDAVAWIASAPRPWLCYVGFHAAHTPLHAPPPHLHGFSLPNPEPQPAEDPTPYFNAMIEALDTEIGRLLAAVDYNTTVILVGDNGTAPATVKPPFDPARCKGTVHEGGIRVPLVVRSPRVTQPGAEVNALVSIVDVFATVADLARVDLQNLALPTLDSLSFSPYFADPTLPSLRTYVFSETFSPIGTGPPASFERSIRNESFKLIRRSSAPLEEFFDLSLDPYEQLGPLDKQDRNALQQAGYDALDAALTALLP